MELCLEQRTDYIYARVSGADRTFRTLGRYWRAVADACDASGLRRVVVVDALDGPPLLHELQALIRDVIKPRLGHARIAYVNGTPSSPAFAFHCEVYAHQLGLTARMFTTTDAAIDWVSLM
jgi:hypothetical protein